jgi:hypothetical protein
MKIIILILMMIVSGCGVANFAGSTEARYENGNMYYKSNKNQENFKAKLSLDANGKLTALDIQTTATTPESAIAAALQSNLVTQQMINDLLQTVLPLVKKTIIP